MRGQRPQTHQMQSQPVAPARLRPIATLSTGRQSPDRCSGHLLDQPGTAALRAQGPRNETGQVRPALPEEVSAGRCPSLSRSPQGRHSGPLQPWEGCAG